MSAIAEAILTGIRSVAADEKREAGAHWSGPEADRSRHTADLLERLAAAIEEALKSEVEETPNAPLGTESGSQFADGSSLPEYVAGGSLHRGGRRQVVYKDQVDIDLTKLPGAKEVGSRVEYDGRIHITRTNDAEALADVWGSLVDGEPVTQALILRFKDFVSTNFGDQTLDALKRRSQARYERSEISVEHLSDPELHPQRRYVYGHTGL